MGKVKQMTGRYGRLVVIGPAVAPEHLTTAKGTKLAFWECRCDCGSIAVIRGTCLRNGQQSCGCLFKEKSALSRITHGGTNTPEHNSWTNMLERCYQPNKSGFKHYGGRGIRVCDRWRNSFENFRSDMGDRPCGHTLDRIDPNKDYSPDNCRWATSSQQARNKRNTVYLTLGERTLPIATWAELTGISLLTLHGRRKQGWSDEDILTRPVQVRRSRK